MWKRRWIVWLAAFIGWMLVGLSFGINDFLFADVHVRFYQQPLPLMSVLAWEIAYWPVWAALSPLIFRFARRFPIEPNRWLRNLTISIVAGLLLTVAHRAIYLFIAWLIYLSSESSLESLSYLFHHLFLFNLPTGFMSYGVILLVSHAINYHKRLRDEELKATQLKAELAEAQLQAARAQLQALKMQLHPHFLFNTLNSISALLDEDVEKADEMLARLGDFLRLTLENSGAQMIALRDELEFLRRYLEIEQVRFQDRLSVEMQIEAEVLDTPVPNLILQPIIENAIRHGIAQQLGNGTIRIAAARKDDTVQIEVQDNGPGMMSNENVKAGVGLGNTIERLKQAYGGAQNFAIRTAPAGGTLVTLTIPFAADDRLLNEGSAESLNRLPASGLKPF
jgi:two-component system, LytTR family, sensor kinase